VVKKRENTAIISFLKLGYHGDDHTSLSALEDVTCRCATVERRARKQKYLCRAAHSTKPGRSDAACLFIRSLAFSKSPSQVGSCPAARLWTSKAWGNPGMQTSKALDPATDISGGRSGLGECGMFVLLHDLLLSHEISEKYIRLYRVSHGREKFMKFFHGSLRGLLFGLKVRL
jgi:hypothetical protein